MKVGDVVFYVKSGIIGWETMDNTLMLSKNRPYTVDFVNENDNTKVRVAHVGSSVVHKDHFEVREVIDGEIQGIKIFKVGDEVKLLVRGMIDWESGDYTLCDKLEDDVVYKVKSFCLTASQNYLILNKGSAIHPNHFIKVN